MLPLIRPSPRVSIKFIYLFISLFKNSTQYKQYKIEDTIKAVEF